MQLSNLWSFLFRSIWLQICSKMTTVVYVCMCRYSYRSVNSSSIFGLIGLVIWLMLRLVSWQSRSENKFIIQSVAKLGHNFAKYNINLLQCENTYTSTVKINLECHDNVRKFAPLAPQIAVNKPGFKKNQTMRIQKKKFAICRQQKLLICSYLMKSCFEAIISEDTYNDFLKTDLWRKENTRSGCQ